MHLKQVETNIPFLVLILEFVPGFKNVKHFLQNFLFKIDGILTFSFVDILDANEIYLSALDWIFVSEANLNSFSILDIAISFLFCIL